MIKKKIGNIAFICNEETGKCSIVDGDKEITENNPIVAWNIFWSRAGYVQCNQLRDKLEENGFNRYTGEKK